VHDAPERGRSQADFDAIVIGSGPNGLAGACVLARSGLRVLVLETNATRAGGAVGSEAATRPGFVHDVGAAFFAWGKLSPAFHELGLEEHGLRWALGEIESCHPAPDGTYAAISRDLDVSAKHFGSARDGDRFRQVASWYASIEPHVIDLLLRPFPSTGPILRLLPTNLWKLAAVFLSRGAALARRWFESEPARRVLPGLALHVDVGPDDWFGAALGFMLGMTATTGGYAVPIGGAQSITDAMVRDLLQHGGWVQLGARVRRVLVRDDRACGVVLGDGTEITAPTILADTDVVALLLDLVEREHVPGRVLEFMQHYPRGWGTFKVDWALAKPVPWSCELARKAAVVHAGDSLEDLSRFTAQVRDGQLPDNPYLVIGQQSVLDPSRAPDGLHTLWAYSRVPPTLPGGGWSAHAERFADRIDLRIEALAPGFRQTILERRVVAPPDLEAMDANLVGGDLGGGSNAWHRQLLFRPLFPYFRYRMPVAGLYLCSSYAHPGAGVHGMCGFNAAKIALQDLGA
jgi:phytoene dehydrogenase-like protein